MTGQPTLLSELTDPALVDLLNWLGIEVVQLFPPPPRRNHQPRFFRRSRSYHQVCPKRGTVSLWLRAVAPEDPIIQTLIEELCQLSPDFQRWW
ncbi:hypothetical protein [Vreelandella zhaodongensis]|uniref:Uncharacterized protein n=1 Tax=Vreelandella zhaodongensis TaxID=1176240 RepID=A0ABX2SS23_VREZH|nr:hypothetical protein [Halomonas zhaodongensis]NYS44901.1 hypothetical protein [Halomonas zhaodongensis]